jgi:dTDP-4-amino-4,6-dideoxygalactose transaminase
MQFNDLSKQWACIRENILPKIDNLGYDGSYINGKLVKEFEDYFASYFTSKFAVGVSNGTDGLKIALQLFDLTNEDLVIIPANTYISDYIAVKNLPKNQPKVCLIDHDDNFTIDCDSLENFLEIERQKWKKIVLIPVHLYGHSCEMDRIMQLKDKYDFHIIEDCSQSHETLYKGNHLGNFGDVSVYSLYPGKNLGAMGDAGIITTNNIEYYERMKSLRNYGSKVRYHYDELGNNHRLDSIQSLILIEKLKHLKEWTRKKTEISDFYLEKIKNPKIELPKVSQNCKHSWHVFCLRVKDRPNFEKHISNNGIPTIIHYPIPIHKTTIFDTNDIVFSSKNTDLSSDLVISIPIHPFLTTDEISQIVDVCNNY